ncbi:MAG TPA: LysR family transcriptional regulator [Burkholderiaceae bacterium]|nr:LysR family transcriptional regulator [Burkholderiaceae bacterium]
MKWQLDDLPVFVAVVERGGVSAAARALGLSKSSVSTVLSRLEQSLQLRLLERSTRSVRVTSEGEVLYRQALLILEQAREADALMAGLSAAPAGKLTVALPPAFCHALVAPRLTRFRQRYPHIQLEIVVTSHGAAQLRESADLAVVVGPLEDSELVSRTLLSTGLVWVASPAWLADNRLGESLTEVRAQVQICESRYGLRRLPVHVDGEAGFLDMESGITHVNNPLVVRRVVLGGGGVSMLPRHYCAQQLADGTLVEVLRHIRFDLTASRLTVVYPSRKMLSPRVRAFLEFLVEFCENWPS